MTRQKNISILGATGSIGDSTLSVIRQHPDRFRIVSLTCHRSVEKLCELVHEFR
ncbi:MAG: 1-deoxy-D-xylulose-5-phosphate reductoisomerase, partial [SAR324 cluster bacterium]|nr:1-deoxy-D-xylulose-5-phosphate reductoisomerase [SAR324 cluster bacterium]